MHEYMLCPLVYLFLMQHILLSMQFMFFLDLFLEHMQLLLCSIFYLRVIFTSHHHLITSFSKVSFTIGGSSWAFNFPLPLRCQQDSYYIHCIWYATINCCSWCFLLWFFCHHILMSLSMKNMMPLWVGKSIDTWSNASPSVLWMVSWTLLFWKLLYRYY